MIILSFNKLFFKLYLILVDCKIVIILIKFIFLISLMKYDNQSTATKYALQENDEVFFESLPGIIFL